MYLTAAECQFHQTNSSLVLHIYYCLLTPPLLLLSPPAPHHWTTVLITPVLMHLSLNSSPTALQPPVHISTAPNGPSSSVLAAIERCNNGSSQLCTITRENNVNSYPVASQSLSCKCIFPSGGMIIMLAYLKTPCKENPVALLIKISFQKHFYA